MSTDTKKGAVPRLRFPEFEAAGEWEEKQLKDACQMQAGKFVSASNIKEKREDDLFPCYGGNGLRGYTKTFTHEGKYSLIGRQGALCGNVTLAAGKFHATEHAVVATPKEKVDTDWLYYKLNLLNLNQYATGQAQPGLSVENLDKVKIQIPKSEKEQQKIAATLSSLDDLIAAEVERGEALKAHKRGLMQGLFPAEGKRVPRLRFAGLEGDWIFTELGKVGDIQMCKRIFAEETNARGGVPFYKIGTLGGTPDAFISRELFEEYKNKYNYPRKGEVLITCSGTVGKCVIYDGEDAYYQDSNIVWIDNPAFKIRNELLFYLLSTANWNQLSSTTITRIYGSDLRNLKITFPPSHAEQQKIAQVLASVDELITSQSNKLRQLAIHKIGLMQQLFPGISGDTSATSQV